MRMISNKQRKICVFVTARPSYSRVRTLLQAIEDHYALELQLVVAGSALLDRYGKAIDVIERDGFEVKARIFNVLEGENLTAAAKTTGIGIIETTTVLESLDPDIVVTVADRFETLATAVAAAYMNIPLAHIQGGEVTGSIDEKVRHSITKLSDYHFVSSEDARCRVIKLGERPEVVFNTGCPSIDLAAEAINQPPVPVSSLMDIGVGSTISGGEPFIVVMQHPVTTEYGHARDQVEETLHAVADVGLPAFWFWPNMDAGSDGTSKGIRSFRERHDGLRIRFLKNLPPIDFLRLLCSSECLVGNSSVGIRECSFMGVPVVNVGARQNRRARGHNVIDCGHDRKVIADSIRQWLRGGRPERSDVYGGGRAGKEIANLLSEVELTSEKTISY